MERSGGIQVVELTDTTGNSDVLIFYNYLRKHILAYIFASICLRIMETRRDVFQAIADPTRRRILSTLIKKPQNLNALADQFEMTRQAVSLHVKILQECDVITINKVGRERFCQLKPEKLVSVADWLEPFKKMWEARFSNLDDLLDELQTHHKNKDQ